MRIHFTYRNVDRPWGGANNFTRALRNHLTELGPYTFTEPAEAKTDIMFMNQLGVGPGGDRKRLTVREVKNLKRLDGRRVVVRAVNLYRHAFRMGPRNLIHGTMEDLATLGLLNLADAVIFQSAYQRDLFLKAGFRGQDHTVIHNGASASFWNEAPPIAPADGPLCLVSATASPRANKKHDLILALSKVRGVEVRHFGAWPKGLDTGSVKMMGTCDSQTMAAHYANAHMFLHPAIKDPCPNAIFEAICAGLPILFNDGQGSSAEIVGENGLAIDQRDLAATVDGAKAKLAILQQRVRKNRSYYRIDRATAEYVKIFEKMGNLQ